jgi:arginyl-tRNA synthetase
LLDDILTPMRDILQQKLTKAAKQLYDIDAAVELTRPDEQFGDFATNIALQLAKQLGKNPREIAEDLAVKCRENLPDIVKDVSVAGPGFLNITLTDSALLSGLHNTVAQTYVDKTVVAEYSDPNPFKVLHAGHLYTSVVGDSLALLYEAAGANVHRVNFGGDVGMHVGKSMWAILQDLDGEHPEKLLQIPENERAEWMARAYVTGSNKYEDDEAAKAEMAALNKRVYQLHADKDHDSPFAQIYWTCRDWSYAYFDAFYARIGSKFEKYYPESETAEIGLRTVREHTGSVFEESDGAVIFKGESHGLHTRVFINNEGLPTYEAKDIGLIMKKWEDYHFDTSVVITGNEQQQYMEVVLKAIEQFAPELAQATTHLTHGLVKLTGGVKMSSRKGNILRAVDVLDEAANANKLATGSEDDQVVLGAVKYAFLKQRTGGDIIYDPAESVSLHGNSGPYLQYAHARARSILRKSEKQPGELHELEADERSLVRKLSEYSEVVEKAVSEQMPHHIAGYLYESSQVFNRFYEHNRVIGDAREAERLQLVITYADTLQKGLGLLGITAPEKM